MRDAHRLKEKYDLSLDSRQIFALLVSGAIVLGATFVLGVMVGKRSAAESAEHATAANSDLLTTLDERAQALKQAQADASLTFQEELTRKADPTPRAKPTPAPLPVVEPVPLHAAAPDNPASEAPEQIADATVPTRTTVAAQALKTPVRPAEAAPNGKYTLQIASSQDKAEADRFAAKLRDQGYAPYIIDAQVNGRGSWYRVRMGSFPTKEAAARYLQDFKRETRLDAFVAESN